MIFVVVLCFHGDSNLVPSLCSNTIESLYIYIYIYIYIYMKSNYPLFSKQVYEINIKHLIFFMIYLN